jgi:DNA-binding XRE family transcriptional regulator
VVRVANRVAAELRRRAWSQADLATLTEMPYGVIRRLTRPSSDPPLAYALAVSRAFKTRVESLFWLYDDGLPPRSARRARGPAGGSAR